MKLTQEQIEFVRREQKYLQRLIDSKPQYGLFSYHARWQALELIVELHNIAMEAERKAKIAKGKENLGIDGRSNTKDTQKTI